MIFMKDQVQAPFKIRKTPRRFACCDLFLDLFSSTMPDSFSQKMRKGRSVSLHLPKQSNPTPVPPSLTNSPHLSSPYSMFRQKPPLLKTPSQEDDEWLRDMVPMNSEQNTFDENLLSVSQPVTPVQKQWETSQEGSPSSSGSSSRGRATLFPTRPNMHRSWSSPSTSSPSIVPVPPFDLTGGRDTRRRVV
ncbi:uncharacterized protein EDB93DRAFT_457114 [Suillus bovinus]|uniref:uncharacterized protein n=1 Tax=Suillus bovinus TaxID=48563 RepID=UPI001B868673|nr:uncharacterized protein EDB93DRAFT_457114 [Suillus bovinus]KAG2146926.1 hypothetical protein EDB93DRAFT_457114 [Suillus bovinus]